jgi:hypothetical protein
VAALREARSLAGARQITLGADKGYDTGDVAADLRFSGTTPPSAQTILSRRRSAIDVRTVHSGYPCSIKAS